MQKIKKIDWIGTLYGILMAIVVFSNLFLNNREYATRINFKYNNTVLLILGILTYLTVFGIILGISKLNKNKEIPAKRTKIILIIWSTTFTLILFFLGRNYCFKTDWDVRILLENAEKVGNGDYVDLDNYYYSVYPNNILLTVIFSLAYRIANITKISSAYSYLLLFNSIIYSWTGYFIYRIADMFFKEDRKYSILTYILYVLLIGISPWIVIPYSDSVALGALVLCVFTFFKIYNAKSKKEQYIYIFLYGIIAIIGYYIKPQVFIFTIAVVIIQLLTRTKQIVKTPQKYVTKIGVLILAILIAFGSIKVINHFSGFKIDPERKYGIPHFLMLGWNSETYGTWNQTDIDYSAAFDTSAERKAGNIKKFKERIKDLKPNGIAEFALKKLLSNYNDGTFTWGAEGVFFVEEYDSGIPKLRNALKNYYWNTGEKFWLFRDNMQMIWLATLLFGILIVINKTDTKIKTLILAIMGLTLFEILFECRARYLFSYAPIYIFIGVIGFRNLVEKAYNKIGKNRGK